MKRRIFKILRNILFLIVGLYLVVLFGLFKSVDYTHYSANPSFKKTIAEISKVKGTPGSQKRLYAGWSRENITPSKPARLVAYGNRGKSTGVKDSLYVSAVWLKAGQSNHIILTYDLLVVHPHLRNKIEERVRKNFKAVNGIYWTASHTHSSFGHWDPEISGGYISGDYDETIVASLIEKTEKAVKKASQNLEKASIAVHKQTENDFVINRVLENEPVDAEFRMLFIKNESGKELMLCSYGAHPTCLSNTNTELSNDYPNYLTYKLKDALNLDMCIFSAGTVGSQGPAYWPHQYKSLDEYGDEMQRKICQRLIPAREALKYDTLVLMCFDQFELDPGKSQLRSRWFFNRALRSWVFDWFMGKYKSYITFFKINEIFLVGTPCDFSGTLYNKLKPQYGDSVNVFVTSFNGSYLGYATPIEHYEVDHMETHELNWFGPYFGEYLGALIVARITAL